MEYHLSRAQLVNAGLIGGCPRLAVVEKESYLLELARYIVLNPVRARMVHDASQWPWSSYQATAGMELPHSCLTRDWILQCFGDRLGAATRRYRQFVQEGKNQPAPWEQLKNQIYLGSDAFVDRAQQHIDDAQSLNDIPKPQPLKPVISLGKYEELYPARCDPARC